MPAHNKRFGEIGGEVIIRISVFPLTGGDCPNCVQLPPQLRQAAGTLSASGGGAVGKRNKKRKRISNILNINFLSAQGVDVKQKQKNEQENFYNCSIIVFRFVRIQSSVLEC